MEPESIVITDEWPSYNGLDQHFIAHGRINHSAGMYVVGDTYTNTVEGFFGHLKPVDQGHLPQGLPQVAPGLPQRVHVAAERAPVARGRCSKQLLDRTDAMSDSEAVKGIRRAAKRREHAERLRQLGRTDELRTRMRGKLRPRACLSLGSRGRLVCLVRGSTTSWGRRDLPDHAVEIFARRDRDAVARWRGLFRLVGLRSVGHTLKAIANRRCWRTRRPPVGRTQGRHSLYFEP